jgi:hypothetical protein
MGGAVNSFCSPVAYDISTVIDGYQCLEEYTVSFLGVNVSQAEKVGVIEDRSGQLELQTGKGGLGPDGSLGTVDPEVGSCTGTGGRKS